MRDGDDLAEAVENDLSLKAFAGEEDSEVDDDDVDSGSDEDSPWIAWFLSLRGNEFFCAVDEDFIQDDFNLTGLGALVPFYDFARDMILDVERADEQALTDEQQELIESAAEMLYGLIHARYITTNRGLRAMHAKYAAASFGRCPRACCGGQAALPLGRADAPRGAKVHVFCPRCQDLFVPRSSRAATLDGAYFGSTFANVFLLAFPDLVPAPASQAFVPRIYGFRIHKTSPFHHAKRSQKPSRTASPRA
ncbi:casein kinase II, regulatory subunit [Pelagophyceae sp. CCMP2097]|nr:casein kinase II, regulatory subunit [Pelagophyceae sp. CCMP2097]